MRAVFLGTGTSQGIPVIGCSCAVCSSNSERDKRLRTSLYVEEGETRLVVDCGPDFRQQLLRTKIDAVDAILFTHEHMDHVAGLDDVRAINFSQGKPMPLYCAEQVELRLRQQFSYAFEENPYPGAPQLEVVRIAEETFSVGNLVVTPIPAMHGSWPVLGFRFGSLTYLTDANYLSEQAKNKIKGSQVFVVNALHHRRHHSHFNMEQALQLIEELGCPSNYLVHMSHHMGLHDEINQTLPKGVSLAWDGLVLEL